MTVEPRQLLRRAVAAEARWVDVRRRIVRAAFAATSPDAWFTRDDIVATYPSLSRHRRTHRPFYLTSAGWRPVPVRDIDRVLHRLVSRGLVERLDDPSWRTGLQGVGPWFRIVQGPSSQPDVVGRLDPNTLGSDRVNTSGQDSKGEGHESVTIGETPTANRSGPDLMPVSETEDVVDLTDGGTPKSVRVREYLRRLAVEGLPNATMSVLMDATGWTRPTLNRALKEAVSSGGVHRAKDPNKNHYLYFYVPNDVEGVVQRALDAISSGQGGPRTVSRERARAMGRSIEEATQLGDAP